MEQTPDFFFDGVDFDFGDSSPTLVFKRHAPKANRNEPIATGRTSYEHLKLLVYQANRAIKEAEGKMGVDHQIPKATLDGYKIGQEDWLAFWRQPANPQF